MSKVQRGADEAGRGSEALTPGDAFALIRRGLDALGVPYSSLAEVGTLSIQIPMDSADQDAHSDVFSLRSDVRPVGDPPVPTPVVSWDMRVHSWREAVKVIEEPKEEERCSHAGSYYDSGALCYRCPDCPACELGLPRLGGGRHG